MKRLDVALMGAVAVLAMTPAVMAKEGGEKEGHKGGGPEAFFKKADANVDGKLSLDEFKAVSKGGDADAKFKKADADADGSLTLEELTAAKAKHGGHKDKDKGGEKAGDK